MMFSSTNSNVGSNCFGASNGSISSSVLRFSGLSSSPSLLEEDGRMLVDGFLSLLDQNEHEEGLLDHHHHFVDGVNNIAADNFHGKNQLSGVLDTVGEEDVEPDNKRPANRIRTGKRDRHSKICTAKGPRDRRMRLSIQVARKFFDLQDALGFDKASHTIEWLFNASKNAIKEVMGSIDIRSATDTFGGLLSSSTETEQQDSSSPFKKNTRSPRNVNNEDDQNKPKTKKKCKNNSSNKKLINSFSSQSIFSRKDVRNKARARARERTRDKMNVKAFESDSNHQDFVKASEPATYPNNNNTHCGGSEQAGSCSPFDHVDEILINSAQSRRSVEELMNHADWVRMTDDNARLYSQLHLGYGCTR